MRFQVLLSLWSVTSLLCIDMIPEVAKTKVSKPMKYSLSKLRFCHAPPKRLIQTRPHMSTSRCGNICIRRGFSNRSSVDEAMTGRSCEQQRIYGRQFREPRRGGHSDFAMTIWRFWISNCMFSYWLLRVCACACACVCVCVCEREKKQTGSHLSTSAVCVCVSERERERERRSHHSWVYSTSEIILIAACVCVRERGGHSGVSCLNRGLFANT